MATSLRYVGAARLCPMTGGYDVASLHLQVRRFENDFGFSPHICSVRGEQEPVVGAAEQLGLAVEISDAVRPGHYMLQGVQRKE